MLIGEIEIQSDAIFNEYESCSTNAHIIFDRKKPYGVDAIEVAFYEEDWTIGELEDMYSSLDYIIMKGYIGEDLITQKQTIDISIE